MHQSWLADAACDSAITNGLAFCEAPSGGMCQSAVRSKASNRRVAARATDRWHRGLLVHRAVRLRHRAAPVIIAASNDRSVRYIDCTTFERAARFKFPTAVNVRGIVGEQADPRPP